MGNEASMMDPLVGQSGEGAEGSGPLPSHRWVKICGLREPEHAAAAAVAGADLLGFIFASGRRRVTPEQARACIVAARGAAGSRPVVAVGVFVNAAPCEMNETAEAAGIDLIQVHGDETPDALGALRRPAMKAVRAPTGASLSTLSAVVERYRGCSGTPIVYLVDGHSPQGAGGTGVRADWRLAGALAASYPVALAGGLDPGNVRDAIATVRPVGVDVSSGVETGGRKDVARIAAFVAAARDGFAAIGDPEAPARFR